VSPDRSPRFDTAVFDLGGVLADWDPRYLYQGLFDGDTERMEHFLATVTTPEWNHAMDAGRDRAEAVAELVTKHPQHEALIRAWVERWADMLGPEIAGTAQILAELDDAGVRLLALTNWSAETFPLARSRYPSIARFRGVVVSGEHKLAKPDPALFDILLRTYVVDPARAVYVDDRADNVRVAQALGLTGLVFSSPPRLRADLERLGLLAPRP